MPSTGLSLRSSEHWSHLESCLAGSKIFSILRGNVRAEAPRLTSDVSVLPSSSIGFHQPTGVCCADAAHAARANAPAITKFFICLAPVARGCAAGGCGSEQRLVHLHQ